MSKSNNGFLLLETTIVLAVVSLLSVIYIRSATLHQKAYMARLTKENIENVSYAIIDFLAKNSRLPRPSASPNSGEENDNTTYGYIPYKTLGIPRKITLTSANIPLFYVAEANLSDTNITNIHNDDDWNIIGTSENCFCKLYKPSIKIEGYDEDINIAFAITDTKPIEDNNLCCIINTENTKWFTRGLLLTKYLKTAPCLSPPNSTRSSRKGDINDLL